MAAKRLVKHAVVVAGIVVGFAFAVPPQPAFAAVGSGGSGGGGGGGSWGWTFYGHGWDNFSVTGGGPSRGFRTGNWNTVRNACIADSANTVMVYVLGTGDGTSGGGDGGWMGYDYKTVYDSFSGGPPPGGVSSATAKNRYDSLPASDKVGYTWGSNVAWFCWDFESKWGPMKATSTVNKSTAQPGESVSWEHRVWNAGTVGDDVSPTVSGEVRWVNTTGPGTSNPNKTYSKKFSKNEDAIRNYSFTIPSNAIDGQRYCQDIRGDPTSSNDKSGFNSGNACVLVTYPNVIPNTSILPAGTIEVGGSFTARASLQNSTTTTARVSGSWRVWFDEGNQTFGAGDLAHGVDVTFTNQAVAGGSTFNFPNRTGTANAAYKFVCSQLYGLSIAVGTLSAGIRKDCVPIVYKPYLTVYGGDVVAGANALSDGSCGFNGSAGIISYNHDGQSPYGATNFAGAGGKAGVFAMGAIQHFSSGLNITALKPQGLSFANTGSTVNLPGSKYGGQFGNVPAACDFVSSEGATHTNTTNISGHGVADKEYYHTSNGNDVFISGAITYNGSGTGWANLKDIPSFKLVVVGADIYINQNVGRLDGAYIAVPDGSGNGGNIYTCASGPGTRMPRNNTAYQTACNTRLKTYGSFVAKKVHFDRTTNTVRQANASHTYMNDLGAEVFIFGPEMWLPNGTGDGGFTPGAYQGLPPVL